MLLVVVAAGAVWAYFEWWAPRPDAERPAISFAPLEDTIDPRPRQSDQGLPGRPRPRRAGIPAVARRADEDHAGEFATPRQEEIDQIYGRLTAGPIPDGAYQGDAVLCARRQPAAARSTRFSAASRAGSPATSSTSSSGSAAHCGRARWSTARPRTLRNLIEDLAPIKGIIDDVDTVPTATVPRGGLLGRFLPTTTVWMLFPAKVYCGQSLARRRGGNRSSSTTPSPTRSRATARARTVSPGGTGSASATRSAWCGPGFYLGRAYANRAFLLNFTLYRPRWPTPRAEAFAARRAACRGLLDRRTGPQRGGAMNPRPAGFEIRARGRIAGCEAFLHFERRLEPFFRPALNFVVREPAGQAVPVADQLAAAGRGLEARRGEAARPARRQRSPRSSRR